MTDSSNKMAIIGQTAGGQRLEKLLLSPFLSGGEDNTNQGAITSNVLSGQVKDRGDTEARMSTGGGGLERNAGEGGGARDPPGNKQDFLLNRRGSRQPASGFPWSMCGQQPG